MQRNVAFFSEFQYGFRSSRSTADLLTGASDRIARAFNSFMATQAVALDISKAFDRVWYAGLLHKLKFYGVSGQIFGLISSLSRDNFVFTIHVGKEKYKIQLSIFYFHKICDISLFAKDIVKLLSNFTNRTVLKSNVIISYAILLLDILPWQYSKENEYDTN